MDDTVAEQPAHCSDVGGASNTETVSTNNNSEAASTNVRREPRTTRQQEGFVETDEDIQVSVNRGFDFCPKIIFEVCLYININILMYSNIYYYKTGGLNQAI